MLKNTLIKWGTTLFIIIAFTLFPTHHSTANISEQLIINNQTKSEDLYPYIDLIKVEDESLTINDVIPSGQFNEKFQQSSDIEQKRGFFYRENWMRFEINNQSSEHEWILEFAFPLIHEIEIYVTEQNGEISKLYETGADYPFSHREIDHRYFVFNLDLEQNRPTTFYIKAVGSGDLHPPITLWDKDSFVEKTSKEFSLLGIFYGIIIVMIIYNLFLFFSLKLRSYLYYVITISFTLLGKLSINGIAFQYIWPNYPTWNLHAVPVCVSLACISIIIFTRNFLNVNRFIPSFNYIFYSLITMNSLTIIVLPISRYIALYMMVIVSLITFLTALTVAAICLFRGARQARFYLLGWIIFLSGVSLTLLERAVIIPFSPISEYAGQIALTIEVVLLSFALADNINIMRWEKEEAEKKYQESQTIALENLKRADKLKDEFLAITSHELRTPLYGIIGIAESLHDGITGELSDNMKRQLAMIIKSGQRLTYLVDEILDFSKLKYDSLNLDFKPVQINSIIDIVLTMSKPLLRHKPIEVINEISPDLPIVLADENRLQQIFHNLIDNAIKYTNKGKIVLTATSDDNTIKIAISDTGHGMTDEQMKHIFKPFHQGSESISRDYTGVGIGLNIAKDLIELHDGKIHVTSERGIGSTFEVTLPVHDTIPIKDKVAVTVEQSITDERDELIKVTNNDSKNRPKILVADDEVVNLQVLTNQLSLEGYDVLTTQTGESVFEILEEHHIDLLILDIMMPGMSGYDTCKKLRQSYSLMELPILMLTAKNQLKDKMIAFEAGANDYLVKPCDKQELLSRVKTLVRVKTLNEQLIQINLQLEDKVLERTNELKLANEELQMMAQSRRQMLANIAHELGTPVTLVQNYIQSVKKGFVKADDLRFQNLVADKIAILNRLIEDLFDLSMLEAGRIRFNLKRINIYHWLIKLYDRYELTVTQNKRQFNKHQLDDHFKSFICDIDVERMDQLFSNLIDNALKHTDEEIGEVTINSKLINNSQLLIQVIDNGSGIEQQNLPFVFERFYKMTENEQSGTGLGLTIAKQIILHHRGEISVDSELNKGTKFSIVLPVQKLQDEKLSEQ